MSITILIPFYLFEPTFVSIHKKKSCVDLSTCQKNKQKKIYEN